MNTYQSLKLIFNQKNIIQDDIKKEKYSVDESYLPPVNPEYVVFPESEQEIIELVKLCNIEKIPIVIRGGGTSVTGASIPVEKSILVSTEKLNRIIEFDDKNYTLTTQPGVILQDLHNYVEDKNFFYPPDPNSLDSCTIGGNLATNAGGPRCVKYGVTRDYILGLNAIIGTNDKIKYGGKYQKNSTGYNFSQLLIGSEGTLGIITEILLKLIPSPKYKVDMLVPFLDFKKCINLIPVLCNSGFNPAIIEFIDAKAIDYSRKFSEQKLVNDENIKAYLIISFYEFDKHKIDENIENLGEFLLNNGATDVLIAETEKEKQKIWDMRRKMREALKIIGKEKIGEDIVVPRSNINQLLEEARKIEEKNKITIVTYGHAGDGNVHINVVKNDLTDKEWKIKSKTAIKDIFNLAIKLKGTISGEHGIGVTKKNYLNLIYSQSQINLMKNIKHIFDPENILNPGKIF